MFPSDINLAILGIENQDRIHYAMPLRIMEYDTLSYMKQYHENAKNYASEQGLTKDEYLSKMKQTDKFVPVITLVIYYGEKEWDGAKSLKEMLSLPPEMEQYVVRNVMEKLNLSLEAACELAEITVENYKEYELPQSSIS